MTIEKVAIKEQLQRDIESLGLPAIHMYYHGLRLSINPDGWHSGGEYRLGEIVLTLAGQNVLSISTLGDIELVEVLRPANLIIDCRKCYQVIQVETQDLLCYLYWPGVDR